MTPDIEESGIISWDAPEYHHFERTNDWYWTLGIIAISAAILCIIFGSILFAIFILLAGLAVGLYAGREPSLVHYELHPKGIVADRVFYTYKSIESFWIDEHHALPRILLKSRKMFMPYITINFAHIPPEEIKEYLIEYLPEVEHEESWAHRLLEHVGF
jgi:hypothetical protein